ncbi:putative toxin-antitoxin system toxin component, PIN family [Pseudothauera rhizosphaerae]|uniref:Putative toxin-antitoxin system toxin component, PIN family n=1 Tax=Pseudothauera rhizosphaerae TaxID=2565932 RepID=A0A4S4AUD7_9RHOO|nr:putative toxin-antitoxin system toxin component, PIN family [Pseudothauera rhizosphaerae]THF63394.1 putative toxin-antitoxin system toxin component, PIN family [Pseudothauera rhizosphaerae]
MTPPRVVLDTNLALSALVFANGRLSALRRAWQNGRFLPLVSRATTAELMRVLAYPKFRLTADEQRDLLADYLPWCETLRIPEPPPPVPPCRDPFDEPFLLLALAGWADFLVTGDRDLLALDGTLPCPIHNADTFLATLAANQQE